MLTYRKLKDGNWGVYGPVSEMKLGSIVVQKKDGSKKTETLTYVHKSFLVGGVPHAYGVIVPRSSERSNGPVCAECGRGGHLVEDLEDGMLKHYNCCDIPPGGY